MNYIVTEKSITILINNRPEIIDNTHPNFERVEKALKNSASETEILHLMNVTKAIISFSEGAVQVKDGDITYNGKVIHSSLSRRIISLMENGFDITPFTNFMENLYQNPSKSAVDGLYDFLEACNLPITEDGYFLAYKKIASNYTDCYTGDIDNSIGAKPSMPRYEVNEDSNQTCSTGLHVASYSYMSHYSGDRIVICKVHPKDVVAVPNDYANAKMRVCEYEVINEVKFKDEEITPNVITDDEAYADEYNAEEAPEVVELNTTEDTKYKFGQKITDYLADYNISNWNKITAFLIEKNINIAGLVQTCYDLKDTIAITNKLKSLAKDGKFKKKDLLNSLNI